MSWHWVKKGTYSYESQTACLSRAQTLNGCGLNTVPAMGSKAGRSQPGGFSNLKLCSRRANTRKSSIRAKDSPKQTRRPAEKGRKRSTFGGTKSPSSSRNRSGLKTSGSSQISGSWWRDHTFIKTVVPLGMPYPCRVVSTVVLWGIDRGTRDERRRVSVIVASKCGRFFLSSSSGNRSGPMTWSSSWCSLC